MITNSRLGFLLVTVATLLSLTALSQSTNQILTINGHPGNAPVIQINGRNYVEIETLARLAGASLTLDGNQFTLAFSDGSQSSQSASSTPAPTSGFSSDFMRAGIEAMSTIREWHSALASAIANQFPVTGAGLSTYQANATSSVRLAQTAVSTDSDRSAMQFVSNEFQKMKQLSDKYLAKRAQLNYIDPNALQNDSLEQSLVACGRALGAMAASGQFIDDASCH